LKKITKTRNFLVADNHILTVFYDFEKHGFFFKAAALATGRHKVLAHSLRVQAFDGLT
jgi:hypothetical protein